MPALFTAVSRPAATLPTGPTAGCPRAAFASFLSSLRALRFLLRSALFSFRVTGVFSDVSATLFLTAGACVGPGGFMDDMAALPVPSVAARIHFDFAVSWAKFSSTVAPFCWEFCMVLPRFTASREAPTQL